MGLGGVTESLLKEIKRMRHFREKKPTPSNQERNAKNHKDRPAQSTATASTAGKRVRRGTKDPIHRACEVNAPKKNLERAKA